MERSPLSAAVCSDLQLVGQTFLSAQTWADRNVCPTCFDPQFSTCAAGRFSASCPPPDEPLSCGGAPNNNRNSRLTTSSSTAPNPPSSNISVLSKNRSLKCGPIQRQPYSVSTMPRASDGPNGIACLPRRTICPRPSTSPGKTLTKNAIN